MVYGRSQIDGNTKMTDITTNANNNEWVLKNGRLRSNRRAVTCLCFKCVTSSNLWVYMRFIKNTSYLWRFILSTLNIWVYQNKLCMIFMGICELHDKLCLQTGCAVIIPSNKLEVIYNIRFRQNLAIQFAFTLAVVLSN